MRHRFTAAIRLPSPRARLVGPKLGMRGITVAQSGQPFTPILRADNSNTGNTGGIFGSDRPDLLRDPRLDHPTPARWFDTSAFAIAPPYHFGSAGRNILEGPGLFTFDLALSRRFAIREGASLSFDAEASTCSIAQISTCRNGSPTIRRRSAGSFPPKPPRQIQFALRFAF